jgi:predicted transcriptional regulator of viral defense system
MRDAQAIARAHGGAITTKMATAHGISRDQLHWLSHAAEVLVNIESGAYILRDSDFPFPDVAAYVYRTAERTSAVAVASHDTALAMHAISDAMPARAHITVDRAPFRQKHPIEGVRLHFAPLPASDWNASQGIPVTTVPRTIVDMVNVNTDLAQQAARDAVRGTRVSVRLLARQIIQQVPEHAERDRIAHILGVRGLTTEIRRQS